MRKLIGLLALCFLSTCASAPVLAAQCVSIATALEAVETSGVKPLIIQGDRMKPFIALANAQGATGLEHSRFIAIVFNDEGAAVFFGNVGNVCGPLMLNREQVIVLLRPA